MLYLCLSQISIFQCSDNIFPLEWPLKNTPFSGDVLNKYRYILVWQLNVFINSFHCSIYVMETPTSINLNKCY